VNVIPRLWADIKWFNRACALITLVVFVSLVWVRSLKPNFVDDFAQYYNMGVVARVDAWGEMYPFPIAGSPHNPGATPDSTVSEDYQRVVDGRGKVDGARFIQSPPNALWCWPLAWMSFNASYVAWSVLMAICVWGASVQGARVYQIVSGRESRWAGVMVLVMCLSPLAYRSVRCAVMSPAVGWLLGVAVVGALAKKEAASGAIGVGLALCWGFLTKYASAVLVPVYLIRGKWRELFWACAFALATLAITVAIMGWGPFEVFITRIAPTLGRSHEYHSNEAIEAFLWRIMGVQALPKSIAIIFSAVRIAIGLMILAMIWRKRQAIRASAAVACGAMMALIGWMLLFSPMCWDHYVVYLFPLVGWLIWEAGQSRAALAVVAISMGLVWLPYTGIAQHVVREPLASHVMWGIIGMWAIGLKRLARGAA